MAKLENLDPTTPMFAQFKEKTGHIVLANTFVVPKDKSESFLAHFKKQAEFMKSQPGFVSLQMHQGTAGSQLFMNVAIWESTEAPRQGARQPAVPGHVRRGPRRHRVVCAHLREDRRRGPLRGLTRGSHSAEIPASPAPPSGGAGLAFSSVV